jgi:hypothetical protein
MQDIRKSKDYIIEDNNFITLEEQHAFINKIFSNNSENEIPLAKWRVVNAIEIIKNNASNIFPYRDTPLAFKDPSSKPFFMVLGDIELKDFQEIFDKFCAKHNIKYDKILRSRIAITGMNDDDSMHYPHVDTIVNHDVFLYYLHDIDGDTVFYNKWLGDKINDPEIIHRVTPKMGKAVRFNGHQFHSNYTTNKQQFRCVLNVCYTLKKEESNGKSSSN